MKKTFVIVKTIVINDEREVLILKRGLTAPRRPGTWDLPGGFVDDGEDISFAARREVHEETGIELAQVSLLYGVSDFDEQIQSGGNWLMFIGRAKNSKYKISWEHDEAMWVPAAKLTEYITAGRQAVAVAYIQKHDLLVAEHNIHPS